MKIELTILIVVFIANQFLGKINGSKINKKKAYEPKTILKEITTGFEKCTDQSNKREDVYSSFKKCLNGIKTHKNFLDKNDKSTKGIFKKVLTKLFQCMKPSSKSKKSKKDKKKTSKKNRRRKRQIWQELVGYPDDELEQMFLDFSPYELLSSGADFCPRFKGIIHNMFFNFFDQPPWNVVSSGKVQRYLINHVTVRPNTILKIFTRRPRN